MSAFDSMQCPGCGATLPLGSTSCSCGYTFVTSAPSAMSSFGAEPDEIPLNQGSLIGGLALGFFCGCIGLAIAYFGNFGSETKRGALIGFVVGAVVGVALRLLGEASRY